MGYVIKIMLFFIFLGASFNKLINDTGQKNLMKSLYRRISDRDFSFIEKYSVGKDVNIESFNIEIEPEDWQKIVYFREIGANNTSLPITEEMQEKVNALFTYNNEIYKVKLGLTGYMFSNIKHPYKWSFSINVKDGKTIMGMKKFALLVPETRGYLTDWVATEMLKANNVIGLRTDIINLTVNGKNHGVFYLEERYDKRLIENNGLSGGIIFKLLDNEFKIYGLKKKLKNKEQSEQLVKLKQLIHAFLNNEIGPENIFDLKKFASLFVVSDIMNQVHAIFRSNLRFYFNPKSGLIEPIGREWGYLRKLTQTETELLIGRPKKKYNRALHNDQIIKKLINSYALKEEYIKQAEILSKNEYLDSILDHKSVELNVLMKRIYKEQPFYLFPKEIMHENQDFIRDKLYRQSNLLDVFYVSKKPDSIVLKADNKIDLPIEIYYLTFGKKNKILPKERIVIKSNYNSPEMETFSFPLTTDFTPLDSVIKKLELHYGILGTNDMKSSIIFP